MYKWSSQLPLSAEDSIGTICDGYVVSLDDYAESMFLTSAVRFVKLFVEYSLSFMRQRMLLVAPKFTNVTYCDSDLYGKIFVSPSSDNDDGSDDFMNFSVENYSAEELVLFTTLIVLAAVLSFVVICVTYRSFSKNCVKKDEYRQNLI
jgi:hypothetical protein